MNAWPILLKPKGLAIYDELCTKIVYCSVKDASVLYHQKSDSVYNSRNTHNEAAGKFQLNMFYHNCIFGKCYINLFV